jgi:hypothetical protein
MLQGKRLLELWYGGGKCLLAVEFAQARFEERKREHKLTPSNSCIALLFCKANNILTWRLELLKRFPMYQLIENPTKASRESIPAGPYILLFQHHLVAPRLALVMDLIKVHNPCTLILDESTAIKNPSTKISEAFHTIAERSLPPRIGLTGNAIPESPREIWSQFQFVYGSANPLGPSYYAFRRRWFISDGYGWHLDHSKRDTFFTLLTRYTCTLNAETMPLYKSFLSQFSVQPIVELYTESPEQRRLLDYLYSNWALPRDPDPALAAQIQENFSPSLEALSSDIEMNHTMAVLSKAQQISSGFYYDEEKRVHYLKHNPKLAQLVEIVHQLFIEKPDRQIIVWSALIAEREPILNALTQAGYRATCGTTEENLLAFCHPEPTKRTQIIIARVAASHGLNELANADTAIFFSNAYSQELRNQAATRNTEARQHHPVVSIIDLCGSAQRDLEIVTSLQAKNFTLLTAKNILNKYSKPLPSKRTKDKICL